ATTERTVPTHVATTPPVPPPSPSHSAHLGTATPIRHVVFIIKENRSFDSLFGLFPGADGTTSADDHGRRRPLIHDPAFDQRLPHDLPHDYPAALLAYDDGKMDGFTQDAASARYAYVQLTPDQL